MPCLKKEDMSDAKLRGPTTNSLNQVLLVGNIPIIYSSI